MLENGQCTAKNEVEALKYYRKAAEQGDTDAQYKLGLMQSGSGAEREVRTDRGEGGDSGSLRLQIPREGGIGAQGRS